MSAREKVSLTHPVKKLGIIAGGGALPQQLVETCRSNNMDCYVVGLRGHADSVSCDFKARIGAASKILGNLKDKGFTDLVFIGSVKRPNIFNLWPDWLTTKFLFKNLFKSYGDDSLLSLIRAEIESMGFQFHGIHQFMPELLMPEGILGKVQIPEPNRFDIQAGITASQELGRQDIGQAVIIKDGKVIGQEDRRGTSALIKRHGKKGAVLVKTCKPQQDKDLDLPAIGPETAQLCASKKMAGIAGQTGNTLLIEKDQVAEIANENGLFLVGVTIHG